MKKFTAIAMGIVMLLTIACKKENDTRIYNPVGFWRGGVSYIHTVLITRPNGTASIYLSVMGYDTARAETKSHGAYTVSGNNVEAYGILPNQIDTLYIRATLQSNNEMTGAFFATLFGQYVECKLKRE